MASQETQQESTQGSSNADTDQPPLWSYVTKLEKQGVSGGCWQFKCNVCKDTRKGSYSRVRAHLLGLKGFGISICKSATAAQKLEMKQLEEAYEAKKAESKAKEVALPCEAGIVFKKRKGSSGPLERAFGVETRDQLDQEIARMFYTEGLPFNLARNPHYLRAFQFAAANKIDGYVPPSYNKLRTTLLQKEKDNVQRQLEPLKSTWKERGVTIVSDGWSDPIRKPLINFMATSGNGPLFLKAVNCFGEVKDRFFIADLMKEDINEIGNQNVVQIITDNAANCKAAGQLIEGEFPHIYWTPCVVHTLNLAVKNICSPNNVETNALAYEQCSWIKDVHGDAIAIKNFIMNHNMRLSIFSKFTSLRLLSVADTRFAYIIVMLKRFKLIKTGLQAVVISEEWSSYREDDTVKANFVKEKIMWDSMIEKVKIEIYKKEKRPTSQKSIFYDVVHGILVARWAKNNTPLHCLAHSLNPRYYSDEWLLEDDKRSAPHRDREISQERAKCLRRLFPNPDEHRRLLDEYAMLSTKSGCFSDLTSIEMMGTTEPKSWWVNFGAQTPFLQTLALRLLGQPCSSSCAERNWSTYSFIHSLRRNKLTTSRAQDLVYIHNNLRLLSRNPTDDEKMWDVGGDAFDSMEDVGFLEFADLSLDEPEFESDLIIDS
ncbi:HAT dimerization domain, Ribonuclease H-like domain protein [Artemisia annua]|uniref:HAT dimerization domain, Ribonuclease H-like domain protein n=1 Tax=Artemisia annua TaxID=35608 RepID=A0A2U1N2M8_ARTAN|nr:HAT dimerization domain, Ribonuclease H-like domain protein [Artemisia annua]